MKTTIAISPMMRNVLSVAKIPPAAVKTSHMARIAPRIIPMMRPISPVCARASGRRRIRGHIDELSAQDKTSPGCYVSAVVHRARNVLAKVPAGMQAEVKDAYWALFGTEDLTTRPVGVVLAGTI